MDVIQIYKTIPTDISKKSLINELLTFFSDTPRTNSIISNLILNDTKIEGRLDRIKLVELIGYLHQKSKEDEKISNTDKRKHFGIYYTPYSIARQLAKELVENETIEDILNKKFLEPCSGIGIFIIAYIDEVIESKKIKDQKIIQKIIDNIYYADIDQEAVEMLKIIIPLYVQQKYGVKVILTEENSFIGNILFRIEGKQIEKQDPVKIFGLNKKFDFVLTNPPYKLLKANSNKYKNDGSNNHHDEIKEILEFIRKNNIYKYNEGTLNYYKIFIEEIIENYTQEDAKIGLLIPITLLNDKQSSLLRKRILDNFHISRMYTIPENNIFFQDISQAFCFFILNKKKKTKNVQIISNVISEDDFDSEGYTVNIDTIKNTSNSYSITITDADGIKILKKLANVPKLGGLGVLNLRGELDVTLHKNFISKEKTEFPLLRGVDIDDYSIKGFNAFVKKDFLNNLNSKISHIKSERIVGQQISNMHSKKRLKFAIVENGHILGNSCNYLLLSQNLFGDNNLSLKYLLGILNSKLIDWRFRITNSNNHVSNYEISELPIMTAKDQGIKKEIETLVDKLIEKKDQNLEDKLNNLVFDLYKLDESERNYINSTYAS